MANQAVQLVQKPMDTRQLILDFAAPAIQTLVSLRDCLSIRTYQGEGEFIAILIKLRMNLHWALSAPDALALCRPLIGSESDLSVLEEELITPNAVGLGRMDRNMPLLLAGTNHRPDHTRRQGRSRTG